MDEVKTLDPKTLKSWLDNDEALLIDVREPVEYNESYIEKAINIPLSQLLTKIHEISDLRKKKIVLQCKSGTRSMMGCQSLKNDGLQENIWNLEGGIYNWVSSGLPVKSRK
ncbi:MAG: rhodanese-like domain-containing protein [Rickettsiaceae bacterium]